MNFINFYIAKFLLNIKFVNMINIINNKEVIPELIQSECNADEIFKLAEKWFGPISSGKSNERRLISEAPQNKARRLTLERDVPYSSITKAYPMCSRLDPAYYSTDVITDILSLGQSSRFNQKLVKEKELFLSIDAYITGNLDPGLLIIEGKPRPGISIQNAEAAIQEEILILASPSAEAGYLATPLAHKEGANEHDFSALDYESEPAIVTAAIELINHPTLF